MRIGRASDGRRYSHLVGLDGLRGRVPLVAFVLLAFVCLGLLGFACACRGDQPGPALERGPTLLGLVEVWPVLILAVLAPMLALLGLATPARARASPAQLQRFLF